MIFLKPLPLPGQPIIHGNPLLQPYAEYFDSLDRAVRSLLNLKTRVATDFSVTSSITLANVPGLSVNLLAGRTYSFEAVLLVKSGAHAGGVQAAISGTATATDIRYDGFCMDTGGTPVHGYVQAAALGTQVAAGVTLSDASTVYIHGTITVNAGGTLTVQAAQNSSSATPTVFARGSFFIVRDMT